MLAHPLPPPATVLRLGDPRLRQVCAPVAELDDPDLREGARRLAATLADFRRRHGFGRGIAAPQIGVPWRLVALDLGDGPRILANPELTWRSSETFTLWDDCMSFPELLVKVRRHRSVSLRFLDEAGRERRWEEVDRSLAELLQHELDHLDGVLALDRAVDRESIVLRDVFLAAPDLFAAQADALIPGYLGGPGAPR